MSILTVDELDFLASLRTDWPALYRNELARLLDENAGRCRRHPSSLRSLVSSDAAPNAVYQVRTISRGS
jgi:hypothetical protein